MRILITGACGVTSRAVARSLRIGTKFPGLYLLGTDICDNPYGLYEGLLDRIYRAPRVSEPGYREWMQRLCREEKVDAAIVIPELEALYWSAVGFPVPAILPPPKFCQIAVSKKRLYEALAGRGLVPRFHIYSRAELAPGAVEQVSLYPCWIRDFGEGTSCGKGSLLAHGIDEVRAWVALNPGIGHFMFSEYLPGRNFACHLLYDRGTVVKIACYERLEYFMARTVISGVTGNISKGRLMNDERLVRASEAAVDAIIAETEETMHGLIAVDFREAADGRPMITEINLRHVAATYSFAAAGFNLSEAQLLLTLGRRDELGERETIYPERNMILRDIDGEPIWLSDFHELAIGEAVSSR
jgi:carbamoyl-phosphate synthase large subunit